MKLFEGNAKSGIFLIKSNMKEKKKMKTAFENLWVFWMHETTNYLALLYIRSLKIPPENVTQSKEFYF